MSRSTIIEQLRNDYPGINIVFNERKRLLMMGDRRISLLNDPEELNTLNIFSHAGRNYYQAIVQLLCSKFELIPVKGSHADSLITTNEDYDNFKLKKLSQDYGIGFLESSDDVIAVKITSDAEKKIFIEEDERIETPDYIKKIENLSDYAKLIEIKD